MPKLHSSFLRGLTAAIVVGAWTLSAQAADSTTMMKSPVAEGAAMMSKPDAAKSPAADMERLRKQTERRLALMKDELGINASQETAWGAYAKTALSLLGSKLPPLQPGTDSATVVRYRAQQAAENAEKLTQLADATAKLEAALTPEQRKTLYQMVQPPVGPHAGMH